MIVYNMLCVWLVKCPPVYLILINMGQFVKKDHVNHVAASYIDNIPLDSYKNLYVIFSH